MILFVFLIGKDSFPLILMVLACMYWYFHVKDHSWMILMILMMLCMIPRFSEKQPDFYEGRVIEVKSSYAVIQHERTRGIIYYGDQMPVYDSIISFNGEWLPVESQKGFWSYDFEGTCFRKGIRYAITPSEIAAERKTHSIRGMLMSSILKEEDGRKKAALLRIIFGIRSDDLNLQSSLESSGFSVGCVLFLLRSILKYFCYEETETKILTVITLMLCVIFHCPLILMQHLIYELLSLAGIKGRKRLGAGLMAIMLAAPWCIASPSFLIPSLFRVLYCFDAQDRPLIIACMSMLESFLFHSFNPVKLFLYPFTAVYMGLLWLLSFVTMAVPLPLADLLAYADRFFLFLDHFEIPGSPLGAGLPFFACMVFLCRKNRSFSLQLLALFLLFDLTGLFHPFAEVTFINVGQGDSILIREPLNHQNILIDTGKPSQWNALETVLQSKGIHQIHTLIITHSDNDHSGNKDAVIENYHPQKVITAHQALIQCDEIQLLDLNEISDEENENRSSIVSYFSFNHLNYLLMGDIDDYGEKIIAGKYDRLDADILKLSHHGSKTGTSKELLDLVQPELAIVSAGAYSIYHHPSSEVLQKLLKRHIPWFNTREEGDITILALGRKNLLVTSEGTLFLVE